MWPHAQLDSVEISSQLPILSFFSNSNFSSENAFLLLCLFVLLVCLFCFVGVFVCFWFEVFFRFFDREAS